MREQITDLVLIFVQVLYQQVEVLEDGHVYARVSEVYKPLMPQFQHILLSKSFKLLIDLHVAIDRKVAFANLLAMLTLGHDQLASDVLDEIRHHIAYIVSLHLYFFLSGFQFIGFCLRNIRFEALPRRIVVYALFFVVDLDDLRLVVQLGHALLDLLAHHEVKRLFEFLVLLRFGLLIAGLNLFGASI